MHRAKDGVDPVLSSTIDFDEYIKSNLSLSGKGATISNARLTKNRTKPLERSTDRHRSKLDPNQKVAYDSIVPDLSADFMTMNIKKYEQSINMPPRHSQTAREMRPHYREQELLSSPIEPVKLQHSWRAYVDRPRERSPFLPPRENLRDSSSHSGRKATETVTLSRDGSISPKPRSPLRTDTSNSNFNDTFQTRKASRMKSPIQSPIKSPLIYSLSESKSMDNGELFSVYKVRLVTLKRNFASWASFSENSKDRLMKRYRDVRENGLYWHKKTTLCWWRILTSAVSHSAVCIFIISFGSI